MIWGDVSSFLLTVDMLYLSFYEGRDVSSLQDEIDELNKHREP